MCRRPSLNVRLRQRFVSLGSSEPQDAPTRHEPESDIEGRRSMPGPICYECELPIVPCAPCCRHGGYVHKETKLHECAYSPVRILKQRYVPDFPHRRISTDDDVLHLYARPKVYRPPTWEQSLKELGIKYEPIETERRL